MGIKIIDGRIDVNEYWKRLHLDDIDGEVWEDCWFIDKAGNCLDFKGYYLVSSFGRIKSIGRTDCRNQKRHEKIIKQDKSWAYLRVMLSKDTLKVKASVHRLVLFVFKKKIEGKDYCNHINAIRTDNRAENLEWVSGSENIQHAFNIGTKVVRKGFIEGVHKRGKDNPLSKGVCQIDVKTKKVLAKFSCTREASENTGISRDSINQCSCGYSKSAGGFIWKKIKK